MGIKSSLLISFEEAQKRSTAREFERWTKGFQRLCPNEKSGILEKQHSQLFVKEVLGNNVSKELGDRIFRVFAGNTEVMTIEDFVCGMVVLLKGNSEEKLNFVFYLYNSEQQVGFVSREEVEKVLTSVYTDRNRNNIILEKCFRETDGKIFQKDWRRWVSENRNSGVPLVAWIYDETYIKEEESSSEEGEEEQKDVDLNLVTNFKEEEIDFLSKQYERLFAQRSYHARLKKGNFIDRGTIVKLFAPPLPDQLAFHLFNAFVNQGGEFIDFTDFVHGMSMCCRGSIEDRLKFIYDVFETTGEEKMLRSHLYTMFRLIWQIEGTPFSNPKKEAKEEGSEASLENDRVKTFVDKVFLENKSEGSEFMTKEDFIKWSKTQEDLLLLLETLTYIVNVNVGLPPSEPSEERDTIKQLIDYHKKNMRPQDIWHIINAQWWKQWTAYVNYNEVNPTTIIPQPQHPGIIDNSGLVQKKPRKWTGFISYLTGETRLGDDSPKLLPGLIEGEDYVLLPASAGKALSYWYGCQITLTCKVIAHGKNLEIEVYPLNLVFKVEPPLILPGKRVEYAEYPFSKITPLNELKRRACFQIGVSTMSKVRLWCLNENGFPMALEGDLDITLEDAKIEQGQTIVLERQNRDNTWPRGGPENAEEEAKAIYPITPGIAGLRNLGNTCFMNSSLQALSHTHILTNYFISNRYVPEINRDNLLGMNGHVAKEYGAVVHELWPVDPEKKSVTKNYVVVPKDLKFVIGRFAPQFSGFQQHDAQEFLAFLLDGLHEDLNRVIKKPYIQNPDYKGQPDRELAQAFWDTYLLRNQSIVVDLFAGQLKSTILQSCGRKSITFDPFTFLSLPLPIDAKRSVEIFFFYIFRQDRPVKVSVLVDREEGTVQEILNQLSEIVKVDPSFILLASVQNHFIFDVIRPWDRLTTVNDVMHAYELIGSPASFLAPAVELQPVDVNPVDDADPRNNVQQDLMQQDPSNPDPKPIDQDPNLINQVPIPMEPTIQDPKSINQEPQPIDQSSDSNDIIFIRIVHRKVQRTKLYFTTPYTSTLFSSPTIVSFHKTKTTNLTIYQLIGQLFNFMVQKEEKDIPILQKKPDHNNPESEFPFTLKYVNASGTLCSRSPWYSFNIGTLIPPDNNLVDLINDEAIAVDWKPEVFTLKYLRIDNPHGNWYDEHPSVKENWDNLNKPISLDQCLHWFTQEEDLSDDLFCPNCGKSEKTKKKMEIWKPPPMLIIHLKRFSLYNNRWIKSNRLVNFPLTELDPSSWLVEPPEHPLTYDLYACVNHFGRLGGGHYTAYAVNVNDEKWYNFDDNFVKPVEDKAQIVSSAAYLLFYKLRGVESEHVLKGNPPSGDLNVDKIVGKLPIKDNNGGNNKYVASDLLEKANCVVS